MNMHGNFSNFGTQMRNFSWTTMTLGTTDGNAGMALTNAQGKQSSCSVLANDRAMPSLRHHLFNMSLTFFPQPALIYVALRDGVGHSSSTLVGREIIWLSEGYLLDNIADFSDYLFDVTRRVEDARLADTHLTIRDIYVRSSLQATDGSLVAPNMEQHLTQWASEPSGRQLVLLGEYGQGQRAPALMFQIPRDEIAMDPFRGKSSYIA